MNKQLKSVVWLVTGSALLVLMGWRWNAAAAIWIAPVFLIRFFRGQDKLPATLIAIPMTRLQSKKNLITA